MDKNLFLNSATVLFDNKKVNLSKLGNEQIDNFISIIIEEKAYDFFKYFDTDELYNKILKRVLTCNDGIVIYRFADFFGGKHADELADAIIKTKDPKFIYKFLVDIKNAPKEKLLRSLIENNEIEYICLSVYNVNGFPFEILFELDKNNIDDIIDILLEKVENIREENYIPFINFALLLSDNFMKLDLEKKIEIYKNIMSSISDKTKANVKTKSLENTKTFNRNTNINKKTLK